MIALMLTGLANDGRGCSGSSKAAWLAGRMPFDQGKYVCAQIRVRRQGLEPRTRGFVSVVPAVLGGLPPGSRVDCWGAPHALPAPTSQESARNTRNAQRCDRYSFHEPFHGIPAWRGEFGHQA